MNFEVHQVPAWFQMKMEMKMKIKCNDKDENNKNRTNEVRPKTQEQEPEIKWLTPIAADTTDRLCYFYGYREPEVIYNKDSGKLHSVRMHEFYEADPFEDDECDECDECDGDPENTHTRQEDTQNYIEWYPKKQIVVYNYFYDYRPILRDNNLNINDNTQHLSNNSDEYQTELISLLFENYRLKLFRTIDRRIPLRPNQCTLSKQSHKKYLFSLEIRSNNNKKNINNTNKL